MERPHRESIAWMRVWDALRNACAICSAPGGRLVTDVAGPCAAQIPPKPSNSECCADSEPRVVDVWQVASQGACLGGVAQCVRDLLGARPASCYGRCRPVRRADTAEAEQSRMLRGQPAARRRRLASREPRGQPVATRRTRGCCGAHLRTLFLAERVGHAHQVCDRTSKRSPMRLCLELPGLLKAAVPSRKPANHCASRRRFREWAPVRSSARAAAARKHAEFGNAVRRVRVRSIAADASVWVTPAQPPLCDATCYRERRARRTRRTCIQTTAPIRRLIGSRRPDAKVQRMRTPGVEPGSQAWEACMMPLHYVRSHSPSQGA